MISAKEAFTISNSISNVVRENLPGIEAEIKREAFMGNTQASMFLGLFDYEYESIIEYMDRVYGYNGWLTQMDKGPILHIGWSKEDD